MVTAAQWHREFIAHLAAERWALREAHVVPLSQPYPWTLTVLVDELDAEVVENFIEPFSNCSCGDSVGLHEEIGWDLLICIDLLDHLQGKRAASSQDFGRARTRAEDIRKLRLTVP